MALTSGRARTLLASLLLFHLLVSACVSHDEKCVYNIKVISAPVKGSHKNTKLRITFYDSLGEEASFAAIRTSQEPECHDTGEFYNTTAPCLHDICKMRVHFDEFDADIVTPRAFLTSVEVGTVHFGEGKRRFDVNGWLAIDEPPFLIDRTFDLCSWTRMPRTTATTTTITTTGTTKCTTNMSIDGSTTTTTSLCTITTTVEPLNSALS